MTVQKFEESLKEYLFDMKLNKQGIMHQQQYKDKAHKDLQNNDNIFNIFFRMSFLRKKIEENSCKL